MAASVPERCPQCHSPVAERFPHAVMYDCGFSLFNDGQPVTDDYPAECQRRRIKRLEKQLAAARAEAERWRKRATPDKVALIRGPWYGPYEYLYVNAQRISACVHACDGISTEALEAGVIRDLINAATRYLQITTRDTDDDPNCWAEEEHAEAHLREVLAKVRGEA